jgi:uncharacterized protein YigE (DUF2233 family)
MFQVRDVETDTDSCSVLARNDNGRNWERFFNLDNHVKQRELPSNPRDKITSRE